MHKGILILFVIGLIAFCCGDSSAGGAYKEGTVTDMESVRGTALKSPGFATFLSFILPGLGQFYNGDMGKAMIMGAMEAASWIVIGTDDIEAVGYVGLGLGRIVSPVDAYYSAVAKNKAFSLKIDDKRQVFIAFETHF